MDNEQPTRIVAVVRDLFFAIRIRETLAPRGYAVEVANRPRTTGERSMQRGSRSR